MWRLTVPDLVKGIFFFNVMQTQYRYFEIFFFLALYVETVKIMIVSAKDIS